MPGVPVLGRSLGVRGERDLADPEPVPGGAPVLEDAHLGGSENQAFPGMWPSPAEALAPVADSCDPVERVAFACGFLLRGVLAYQGAVRAMIAATITHSELAPSALACASG